MNKECIYTITALANASDPKADWKPRCFGYYFTEQEAKNAVATNHCDLNENYYTWLVIEKIKPGIHRHAEVVMWYYWQNSSDAWIETSTIPEHLTGVINFVIG